MGHWTWKSAAVRAAKQSVIWAIALGLAGLACEGRVVADHPSHAITADLGPGNEDFEKIVLDFKGFSNFKHAVERARGFDLSGRDLRMAKLHLYDSNLHDVNFDGANLTGANFDETFFNNCTFRGAVLRKVSLKWAAYLRTTSDLTGADISGSWIKMSGEQLVSTKNYQEKNLSCTTLDGKFRDISFAGFNLQGARFIGSLVGCDLTDADISACRIRLSKQQLCSTKNYKQRNLDGIHFIGCDFRDVDFSEQNLGYFEQCDLTGADLTNACLSAAPIDLEHMLPRACPGPGFDACQLKAEQFYATRTYMSGKLPPRSALGNMNLEGWDFSGMELYHVGFAQSSLKHAVLRDTRGGLFERATGLSAKQMAKTYSYKQFLRLGRNAPAGLSLPKELTDDLLAKPVANGN